MSGQRALVNWRFALFLGTVRCFFSTVCLSHTVDFRLTDLHTQNCRIRVIGMFRPACLISSGHEPTQRHARRSLTVSREGASSVTRILQRFALASSLGRPVTHMVRGHDHVEQRFAIYPAYGATPILTTVALSRRLSRELFGSYERTPTVALR